MERDSGVSKRDDPWPWIGWSSVGGLVVVSAILGFIVLPRYQQNGPTFDIWNAICRGLGITADTGPSGEPQPPLQTPTRIAWTSATLAHIASGNSKNGTDVALNCSACHGEQGVSPSNITPTLGGMDAAAIYKQLDDFRSNKRLWDVMNGIATALTDQEIVDVATYFASRAVGLPPVGGEGGRPVTDRRNCLDAASVLIQGPLLSVTHIRPLSTILRTVKGAVPVAIRIPISVA
jgi:cytochrome c553